MTIDDMSNSRERQRLRAQAGPDIGRLAVQSAIVAIEGKEHLVTPDGDTVKFDPPLRTGGGT